MGSFCAHDSTRAVTALAFSAPAYQPPWRDVCLVDARSSYEKRKRFYMLEEEIVEEVARGKNKKKVESELGSDCDPTLALLSGDVSGAIFMWKLTDLTTNQQPEPQWFCGVETDDGNEGLFGDGCTLLFWTRQGTVLSKEVVPVSALNGIEADDDDASDDTEFRLVSWDQGFVEFLSLDDILDDGNDGILQKREVVQVCL